MKYLISEKGFTIMFNKLKYILPIVMTAILGLSAQRFADSNTWDKPVATSEQVFQVRKNQKHSQS